MTVSVLLRSCSIVKAEVVVVAMGSVGTVVGGITVSVGTAGVALDGTDVKVGVANRTTGVLVGSTACGVSERGGGLNSSAQAAVARSITKKKATRYLILNSPIGRNYRLLKDGYPSKLVPSRGEMFSILERTDLTD